MQINCIDIKMFSTKRANIDHLVGVMAWGYPGIVSQSIKN